MKHRTNALTLRAREHERDLVTICPHGYASLRTRCPACQQDYRAPRMPSPSLTASERRRMPARVAVWLGSDWGLLLGPALLGMLCLGVSLLVLWALSRI